MCFIFTPFFSVSADFASYLPICRACLGFSSGFGIYRGSPDCKSGLEHLGPFDNFRRQGYINERIADVNFFRFEQEHFS